MRYKIKWHTDGRVVHLQLVGEPTRADLTDINDRIEKMLDGSDGRLVLVIDAIHMKTGYPTIKYLRDTQKCVDHRKLEAVFAVSEDKLTRLALLMTFSMRKPQFILFDSYQRLEQLLQLRA